MSVETIALDETQSLMIVSGIMRLKENQYFKDGIADEFQSLYAENLALRAVASETKQELFPEFYKLKISENKLQYLIRLTGMNPLDEQEVREYKASLENNVSPKGPHM